jgi:monooxygenase
MERARTTTEADHLDVLIVGAGLSGIGAACRLVRSHPERTFAVLESRDAIGGTWDLFRYPGIRSDSDMHTLGYDFAPWTDEQAIADGPKILDYIRRTAERYHVTDHVRYGRRVIGASWSEADSRWTVRLRHSDGESSQLTCDFIEACTGYYDYDEGYTPEFPGLERFAGQVIHPQQWPEDLDYAGKKVLIIGSGATAITLLPAMTDQAAHVTMLQRSPTYVVSLPREDPLGPFVHRWLSEKAAYHVIRAKNVLLQTLSYQFSRRAPALMKKVLRKGVVDQTPAGFDVDRHFAPAYDPWDQRLCVSPNGDLFQALRDGTASVVTDQIETFTERGVTLRSGQQLEADIVITATGLKIKVFGGIEVDVDGTPVDPSTRLAYRAMMLSGVPNLAFVIGYTNASWTLKADLVSEYVSRLLTYMDAHGYRAVRPPADPRGVGREPLMDLSSGYIQRAMGQLPSQGSVAPWRVRQNYVLDYREFTRRPVNDGVLEFSRGGVAPAQAPALPASGASAPAAV